MNDFNDPEAESKNRGPGIKRPCTNEDSSTETLKSLSQAVSSPVAEAASRNGEQQWSKGQGGGQAAALIREECGRSQRETHRPVSLWNVCRPVQSLQSCCKTS